MKSLILASALMLTLPAAAQPEPGWKNTKEAALGALDYYLVDLEGSRIQKEFLVTYRGAPAWCFKVNPRNSMGGFDGWEYLLVQDLKVYDFTSYLDQLTAPNRYPDPTEACLDQRPDE